MVKKILSLVMISSVLASCASDTILRTRDKDVKIYVDGQFRGNGFTSHSDSKTLFANTTVRLEKDGCREMIYNLPRGEELQTGPFIAGFFLLVPFLWASGYKAEHTYEFSCQKI